MNPRLKGWDKRLIELLEYELSRPFDWGTANCGHIICASIRACQGEHPIFGDLAKCVSEQTTIDLLYARGGFDKLLGDYFKPTPRVMASQGDIALIEGKYYDVHKTEYIPTLIGSVVLDGVLVGKRDKGNFRLPLSIGTKFFKV